MIILPAIDIKDGMCVRLYKGDYSTAHKVAESAVETAKKFESDGAKYMHMVDLDGAKDGKRVNSDVILEVRKNCGLKIEVGGGIRSMESVEFYLENGIDRVILGSAAIRNPEFVKEAVKKYASKIAVSVDALNGMVSADGWTDTSEINYIELSKRMEDIGVQYIIFTDISKDGMLSGPNLTMLDELKTSVSCNIIASGGVSNLKDIINLTDLDIYGAICGKSIYSGTLELSQAIEVAHAAKHNGKGANI
ncbi:MAG: 1-(5-phosphoribosyl)-5-[(5-phosphoribosylamino)methylideneamino]imidazole-4-carboxamide isomerase [Acutalibacteraceae bacterium]